MRILSEYEFVSASVVSGNLFKIRARDLGSLKEPSFFQGFVILSKLREEYLYRLVIVTRGIDYAHVFHQVWNVMHQFEKKWQEIHE